MGKKVICKRDRGTTRTRLGEESNFDFNLSGILESLPESQAKKTAS